MFPKLFSLFNFHCLFIKCWWVLALRGVGQWISELVGEKLEALRKRRPADFGVLVISDSVSEWRPSDSCLTPMAKKRDTEHWHGTRLTL